MRSQTQQNDNIKNKLSNEVKHHNTLMGYGQNGIKYILVNQDQVNDTSDAYYLLIALTLIGLSNKQNYSFAISNCCFL